MRFISTFAGVGGFDLALEARGHTCVGQVEIDKFCNKVLAEHWPAVPRHDDIRTARDWADDEELTGAVDVVVGGFPCQDLSVAGRRAGLQGGERSSLFFDLVDFAVHVGAKHIVFENVPGLLTSHDGDDMRVLVETLAESGFGHVEWRVLDSQFFGVPQRRRRVFIVATSADLGGRQILVESEDLRWNPVSLGAAGPEVAGAASFGAGGEGELVFAGCAVAEDRVATLLSNSGGTRTTDIDGATWIVKSKRARSSTDDESWIAEGTVPTLNVFDNGDARATTVVGFNWMNGGGYGNANPGLGITPEGTGPLVKSQVPAVAAWWDNAQVSPTIDVSLASKGQTMPDKGRLFAVLDPSPELSVRRLTPVECERLQGFPDDHTASCSMSQRYKQMGNAVTVPVVDYVVHLMEVAGLE